MPVLVLQSLALEGGPPRRSAEEKAARPEIGRCPDQVAHPLEPEHRVEDEEGHHRHAPRGVCSSPPR